ncbi:carbohydrate ABC transporter [Streptomyces mirabilis]|uniref:carbohydrate ABC transporter n=1 Tax=Streptomyces sp. NPDC005388 TaxID=3156717 RepID=UPI0033BB2E6C
MNRPLLRSELKAHRSHEHLVKQRDAFVQRHGEELGAFYFLVMLLQTYGKKALDRGDLQSLRALAYDLQAVYKKHTQ